MKRLFLIWIVAVTVLMAGAAPARRGIRSIKQPDGTVVRIEQFGDEDHHWTATTDGTLVVNTKQGCYVAEIDEQGRLSATNILAHEVTQRKHAELSTIEQQATRLDLFHEKGLERQAARRAMNISSTGGYVLHKGSPRIPIILVQYQDSSFTVNEPVVTFEQYFNGETQEDLGNHNQKNLASVRKYFEHCSRGQFTPQFDVIGPVTLPENMAYYGGKASDGSDDKFSKMCSDALEQVTANNLVEDWGVYDNNNDGKVEGVGIIFAGYGQNQGGTNETMWAKASKLQLSINSKYSCNFFCCSCELDFPETGYETWINGTGCFIHEFSHCMGLPDIYVTYYSSRANNQSMESWDVMDYGLYGNNGWAPAPYLAWQRQVMGWITIEALEESKDNITLYPMNDTENGKPYKLQNPDDENDMIIMENIQKQELYKYAYGHGMLVYHVGYPNSVVNFLDKPNNRKGHPAVATVPSGGVQISNLLMKRSETDSNPYTRDEWKNSLAASPFPGTKDITALNSDMQLPNFQFYEGYSDTKEVGFSLNSITEDTTTGIVTFNVVNNKKPDGIQELTFSGTSGTAEQTYYNLSGQRVTTPTRGLYIVNGRKVTIK